MSFATSLKAVRTWNVPNVPEESHPSRRASKGVSPSSSPLKDSGLAFRKRKPLPSTRRQGVPTRTESMPDPRYCARERTPHFNIIAVQHITDRRTSSDVLDVPSLLSPILVLDNMLPTGP